MRQRLGTIRCVVFALALLALTGCGAARSPGTPVRGQRASPFTESERHCLNGELAACEEIEDRLPEVAGIGPDFSKASLVLQDECRQEKRDSCARVGQSWRFGIGTSRDPAKAADTLSSLAAWAYRRCQRSGHDW